jgi:hypothetical protein
MMQERTVGVLTCMIHIVDPHLYDLLREKELAQQKLFSFRLELFNIYERGARLILKSLGNDEEQRIPGHILVIGMGKLGEGVVLHAIQDWRENNSSAEERLQITVIDRYAHIKAESLCVRYPQLEQVCSLIPLQMEIGSPDYLRAEFLQQPGQQEIERVYVCLDDDSLGLQAGLSLLHQMRTRQIPIVIRMVEDTGLATLLGDGESSDGTFKQLHAFGLLNQTCTPDLLLGGTHEVLARELHAVYLSKHPVNEDSETISDAQVPWEQLPERLQESNRVQAANIGKTLAEAGYRITQLRDWESSEMEFTPQEVELMARNEHERWCQERRKTGWVKGSTRNDQNKIHPDLVDWDVLEDEEKEKNRRFVRGLPRSLGRAGFQIERSSTVLLQQ